MGSKDIEIFHGDCLEVMNQIPDNSVDLILTDIPYGTTNCKFDVVIPFEPMWEHIKRIRKDNAATLLFAQTPFDKVLGCSNIKELKYEWIWEKTAATGHLNAKKMPMKAHENILVFYKKTPAYYPIKTQGHERKVSKSENRVVCINRRMSKHGTNYLYGKETVAPDYDSTERYPRSVIKMKSDKQKTALHPNQKPVNLLKYFIETYTLPGQVVLDFTMGSGSTGEACIETGRVFIGIEKDKNIFATAKQRLQNYGK